MPTIRRSVDRMGSNSRAQSRERAKGFLYLAFGLKPELLAGVRLLPTCTGAGGFAFLGFFASRLLRCWPLAMGVLLTAVSRRIAAERYRGYVVFPEDAP